MSNIVIVIERGWQQLGTPYHPCASKQYNCVMYKVDDAPSTYLPKYGQDDIHVWVLSLSSFKRRFKGLIDEYLRDTYIGGSIKDFEYDLYAGLVLEEIVHEWIGAA